MPTATPKTKPRADKGPDGAKPGAETAPPSRKPFDADGRAKAREGAIVTIGEQEYHRRRKTWEITKALRTLLRKQERAQGRAMRIRNRIDALGNEIHGRQDPKTGDWIKEPLTDDVAIEDLEVRIEVLDDEIDEHQDEADTAAYEIIALLLADHADESPPVGFLKEALDVEDAGDLAAELAGGGEPAADPTTPPSS